MQIGRNKDNSSCSIDICVQDTDKENASRQAAKQRYGISDQVYHEQMLETVVILL